jgi:hypothetical protein
MTKKFKGIDSYGYDFIGLRAMGRWRLLPEY